MNKISALLVVVMSVQAYAKMTPSDMSMAMFRSARIKEPTVFKAKVAVAAWDSIWHSDPFLRIWTQERGPAEAFRNQFLAVRVKPYNARMEQSAASHIAYVKKNSEAGQMVASELRDGGVHAALVCLRHSDNPAFEGACVLDEIEMLESGTSDEISVKFSGTRIGIVKHKGYDMLEGKIAATIKSKLKYFKRPVLRVVILSEENGALVVRDSVMDEPNIKVLNGSDTLSRYTTTMGDAGNEPPAYERFVDEISKNQSDVSKESFSNVTYIGLPMGSESRKTINGWRNVHIFGYARFDKDENAKMLGYRLEMWYRGSCVATYDSMRASEVKKYELPDDWHVSFAHSEKFKYRSPYSHKHAVQH